MQEARRCLASDVPVGTYLADQLLLPLIFLGLGDGRAHFAINAAGVNVALDVHTELIDVRALAPTIAPGEAAIWPAAETYLA